MNQWAAHPVTCARPGCEHPYSDHATAGGPCRAFYPDNGPCLCRGFRWVGLGGIEYQGLSRPVHQGS